MRVAVLPRAGEIRLEEQPVPRPGPGEVLVRVASVGICGSDVHYYREGRIAEYVVREPLVLGHEAGGVVVAVGDGVPEDRVGQRVALEPGVPCRHCEQCRAGRYNLCPDVRFFATPPIDGALAEYVVIAADFAHPVPDALSDDAAGLVEPLSVGVWACHKARIGVGSSLLVTGAGPIGLVTIAVAVAAGATEVVVTDVDADRLARARALGATQSIDASDDGAAPALAGLDGTLDALVECSGAASALNQGLPTLRGAGRAVLVGMGADEVTMPVGLLQGRELVLTGTFRYASTYPAAIALAASGRVDLDALVTGRYGLDGTEEALRASGSPGTVKTVIRPGERGGLLS